MAADALPRSWKWGATGIAEGTVAEIVEEGKAQVTSDKVRLPTSFSAGRETKDLAIAGEDCQPQR